MKQTIVERLREFRKDGDYSYDYIAMKSGLSRSTVYNIFNHPPENPRPNTVSKIAEAMGHTLEEVYAAIGNEVVQEVVHELVKTVEEVERKDEALEAERQIQTNLSESNDKLVEELQSMRALFDRELNEKNKQLDAARKSVIWNRVVSGALLIILFIVILILAK